MNTELLRPFIESAENLRITNIIICQNGKRMLERAMDICSGEGDMIPSELMENMVNIA